MQRHDAYKPLPNEMEKFLDRRRGLSVSGDGIFATFQGEGVSAGLPAVFLRLQDCNLHCGRDGDGWRCDAWYTWDRCTPEFWKERKNESVQNVKKQIEDTWNDRFGYTYIQGQGMSRRLVITGGEPLLQQDKIVKLIDQLDEDWVFEIETNGTILPFDGLSNCQINCSPKLSNSGNPICSRYKPSVLRAISNMPNSWFKFVISDYCDEEEVAQIVSECNIPIEKVLLMGEGTSTSELADKRRIVQEIAGHIGAVAIERNQIIWFGDKRRT